MKKKLNYFMKKINIIRKKTDNSNDRKEINNKIKINLLIKVSILLFIQIIILIILNFTLYKDNYKANKQLSKLNLSIYNQINNINIIELDYENYNFAIIRDYCYICGLISFYIHYLGCINTYISKGYIPIIDLSFPNIMNGFNSSLNLGNPWEFFFNQPFGYSLANIIKKAKNIKYFKCIIPYTINEIHNIYNNKFTLEFYHSLSNRYLSIKNDIIKEANIIKKKLFKKSNNILGVLARGTDYIAKRPKFHPIPPKTNMIFKDIEIFDKTYNYNFIFLTTEDDIIRTEFINKFGSKLKIYNVYKNIRYDYKNPELLCRNKIINGNIKYMKVYLINIIILSKCTDIISARTGGAIGTFIFTDGFRNIKVYNLGYY